jgi:hypothetical protein
LLHPLSSVSGSLRLFQLMPLHIALVSTVVALTVAAFTVVAFIVAASTVVYAPEWRWASVLLLSVLLQSVLPPQARITGQVIMRQAITALPPRSVVHTATITMPPTAAAYLRHNGCDYGRTSE